MMLVIHTSSVSIASCIQLLAGCNKVINMQLATNLLFRAMLIHSMHHSESFYILYWFSFLLDHQLLSKQKVLTDCHDFCLTHHRKQPRMIFSVSTVKTSEAFCHVGRYLINIMDYKKVWTNVATQLDHSFWAVVANTVILLCRNHGS